MNNDMQYDRRERADQELLLALDRLGDRLDRSKAPAFEPRALISQLAARRRMRQWRVVLHLVGWSSAAAAAIVLAAVVLQVPAPRQGLPASQATGESPGQPQDDEGSIWSVMSPLDLSLATSLPTDYTHLAVALSLAASAPAESTGFSLPSLGETNLGDFSFTVPGVSLPSWTERSSNDDS